MDKVFKNLCGTLLVLTMGITSVYAHTYTVKGISFDMVAVEGGTFMMGDAESNDNPAHQVTVSDYMIGKTEVIQELWVAVMGNDNDCSYKGVQNPINSVSIFDCLKFIEKLNELTESSRPEGLEFRLPTEAEWEYAARGGKYSQNYKYAGSDNLNQVAWYNDNCGKMGLRQVATRQPNELGLYDMSGNVWEWCCQIYDQPDSPLLIGLNYPQELDYCVIRGGSYTSEKEACEVSYNDGVLALDQGVNHGLRLVLAPRIK